MATPIEVTDNTFDDTVINSTTPVVVDFWAPWCGPCKQLGPMIEKVIKAANGAVKLVKINIDESPEIAQEMRIQSIPAVYAFKNGRPVDAFVGAVPESQIKAFVEHYNHQRYHESLDNVTPADAYFGRAPAIIKRRERIKRKTLEHRRLQHRKLAA